MSKVLVVGCGYMGLDYAKVLSAQQIDFDVIGRRKEKVIQFQEILTILALWPFVKFEQVKFL